MTHKTTVPFELSEGRYANQPYRIAHVADRWV